MRVSRIGLLVCADGIVPECARVAGCMGAQVLLIRHTQTAEGALVAGVGQLAQLERPR